MKIAIIAPGSRGDVQPYVALGKGLIKAGHLVRLLSTMNHESFVKSNGIEFWPVEVNTEDMIRSEKMRAAMEGGSLIKSFALMGKFMRQGAALLVERGLATCQGMDLVLAGVSGLFVGYSIAQKLEIPFLQAYNIPFTPTNTFPGVLFPKIPSAFGGYSVSHALTRQALWMTYRPTDGVVRKDGLGLPKFPMMGPYKSEALDTKPIIYGLSPSIIPKPADWGNNIHVTGFWFLDSPDDLEPSPELLEFIERGSPPVYIGFGSISNRKPEETTNLIIKALKQTGDRAIMYSGWGGLSKSELPDSVLMLDSVPHTWLFPRVKAVVHHGGAGTTAAGLRGGTPSIVIPFHGDQPFWAQLVSNLGAGPKYIPRSKLTAERLAQAIHAAENDQGMRYRAAELGSKIKSEDGVANAVNVIDQLKFEKK
nr:glycosyltransferase [Candidatus Sigynarchaeota archaeon]